MKAGQRHHDGLDKLYLSSPDLGTCALPAFPTVLPSVTQDVTLNSLPVTQSWAGPTLGAGELLHFSFFCFGEERSWQLLQQTAMACLTQVPLTAKHWASLRMRISALHMQRWRPLRDLHCKVPEWGHSCLLKDRWELVQSRLPTGDRS